MLSKGQRLFLEQFTATPKNDDKQWETLLGIADFMVRTSQVLDAALRTVLISQSCVDIRLSDCARRTLESAVNYALRSLESDDIMEVGLVFANLTKKNGMKGAASLQSGAIKRLLKRPTVNETIVKLLMASVDEMSEFLAEIVSNNGWSQQVVNLLTQIVTRMDYDARSNIIEGLPVSQVDELPFLMDLVKNIGCDIDMILRLHDHLVKHRYPFQHCERFRMLLECTPLTNKWAIANICSNAERFIVQSHDGSGLTGLASVISALIVVDSADIDRVLGALCRAIEKCTHFDPQMVSVLSELVCSTVNLHLKSSQDAWTAICQNASALELILDAVMTSPKPWLLYNQSLATGLDFRVPQQSSIRSKTLASIAHLLSCTLRSGCPLSKASCIFADLCLYQVRNSWKTWRQLTTEYCFAAPWILYGKTVWHMYIPPALYRQWLSRADVCPTEIADLKTGFRDQIIGTAILDLLHWNVPDTGVLLAQMRHVFSLSKDFTELIRMEITNSKIWSLFPQCTLASLDLIVVGREQHALKVILGILDYPWENYTLEGIIIKMIKVFCERQCFSFNVFTSIARIVHATGSSAAIDELDLLLDSVCTLNAPIFPATVQMTTVVSDFLLTRLTSIIFAKPQLSACDNMRSLLRGILRALPQSWIAKFLTNLLPLLVDMQANDFLSLFRRFVTQVVLERPVRLHGLPLGFFDIDEDLNVSHAADDVTDDGNDELHVHILTPMQCCSKMTIDLRILGAVYADFARPGQILVLAKAEELGYKDEDMASNGLVAACGEYNPLFDIILR
ncbi:hypothetical protein PSACC_02167 [Paramicrosporidium saccamoebae]|uniref:Uncharacterized protein n=1 Tax=Paramicrosporidium saccamoebae TaxID=1246581 RepID=A0A2H9TJU0_9FUNG|nr:hypothetical protein PSACC_02167 [Paramicrosporidium saccamoebae]